MAITKWKLTNAWSEFTKFVKGKSVSSADGDITTAVIAVPRKGFVKAVYCEIQTVYTAASTGVVTIGYEAPDKVASVNYFMDNTATLPLVAGMKTAANKGLYFEKGGTITITCTKGTSVADVVTRIFADIAIVY